MEGAMSRAILSFFFILSVQAQSILDFSSNYQAAASEIISHCTNSNTAWERLSYFCDHFPARLSGSTNLEQGIDWLLAEMQKDGLENVRSEEIDVPHWVRGQESATAISPINYKLHMLGLGGSIGTPEPGITAEVLVVTDFTELHSRAAEARGKIILFNLPFTTYGETVHIRSQGAIEAAKVGAVASLIRSVTPYSIRTPHTGMMRYDPKIAKIPHAAISPEDADWVARAQARREKVIITLKMEADTRPNARSRNVLAEWRGTEQPEKYFLLTAHLDSWDVGQGAMDDAGGCMAVWEAVRILKTLNLRPKRSIRIVLVTNEENGVEGARQYFARHKSDLGNYIMAFETDEGVFQPHGFNFTGPDDTRSILKKIISLLSPIGVSELGSPSDSTDLIFLRDAHVPTLDLAVDGTKYFWFHHTDADTVDKLNPVELNRCAAAIAVMAYSYSDYSPAKN
jgi:carboxypeptidase Q